jgi:hypothetical protein
MKCFYINDCPEDMSVHQWIGEQTNIQKYIDTMKPKQSGSLYEFSDKNIDIDNLNLSAESAYAKYGWFGFQNIFGNVNSRSKEYGGLSLSYNPNYTDNNIDIHAQTLGTTRNNVPNDLYFINYNIFDQVQAKHLDKILANTAQEFGTHAAFKLLLNENIIDVATYLNILETHEDEKNSIKRILKNTYTDSWSYNNYTPAAQHEHLKFIIKRLKRSIVRSRLAQIKNINTDVIAKVINRFVWHTDESWFYELRLNLSLNNIENAFGIEIENFGRKSFEPGTWYMWDTGILHRPYIEHKVPNFSRTNYVLAVNPWFDYDLKNDCWIQNEFFGEKHPVDMVIDGDVIEGLTLKSLR